MKIVMIATLLVVVALVVGVTAAPAQRFDILGIAQIGSLVYNVVKPFFSSSSSSLSIMGMSCTWSIKSRISSLKLVYDASFWCPELSSDKGKSSGKKSANSAVENALVDYFNKNGHLLSEAQLAQLGK